MPIQEIRHPLIRHKLGLLRRSDISTKNFRELGELSTGEKHTVKKGETLSEIAKESHTTVDQIAKDNHIKDKNKIAVGQELIINAGSESHVVKHGETLEAIAKRYHVSVDDVAEANGTIGYELLCRLSTRPVRKQI